MQIKELINLLSTLSNITSQNEKTVSVKKQSVYEQFVGRYVLVRHHKMGVNVGYLTSYDDNSFVLSQSRKLWRWQAKDSVALESVAKKGIKKGTRITHEVSSVIIPQKELCGIISIDDDNVITEIKNYPVTEQN